MSGCMGNAAWRLDEDEADDPTFYPTSDDMGEDALQRDITELLRPLLVRYLAEQGIQAYVGADQYIYWVKGDPRATVAPDVYVMPGLPQDIQPTCWKVWQAGVVPSFALEVMAHTDRGKDLVESPRRHDELGTQELVVFDPYVPERLRRTRRVRFRVHRRDERGKLVLVEETHGDRVRSEVLGCHLRAVGKRAQLRLRLATGLEGETLLPTDAEAREEAEGRARVERTRAEAAEAELARMRAEIERLRRGDR
ncbi:Uma2 family endonuclease [Polyangium aurulentum]|uniref:Uma2 family endonuclease n=1 Tax=Polyangium aurulentum TaxID=2567896 RepID=UPI0010ADE97D|nr:Uma2 family endonuclease [Polyangium aurulentum]UQA56350.1 Uma2 family endonuclease [Polyangium aurulentum]